VKRSNRLVILVGVLLAVLAFVGIVVLLNQGTSGEPSQPTNLVTVTVATEAIDIGEPVTPDKAETRQVDPDAALQTRIGDPSLLSGRPALVPIAEGEQITQEKAGLVSTVNNIEAQLEPGEKAVAFQVDRVTGLDFLIQPGDHIDIVLSQTLQVLQPTSETVGNPPGEQRFETIPGLENAKTVKTILQDRRVLYVSGTRVPQVQTGSPSATPAPGDQTGTLETVIIVFAGSDADAEAIKFAQNDQGVIGALTAILRDTEDEGQVVTTGVTLDLLVEQYGIPIPQIVVDLGATP
jgi:pilus assembly protein CpaB